MEYPLLAKQMPTRIQKAWRNRSLLGSLIFLLIGAITGGVLAYFKMASPSCNLGNSYLFSSCGIHNDFFISSHSLSIQVSSL